ncbi:peptidylprolyl isomerase [Dyella sp. SG609]|uniref:peptidylprolyl isomerase n=1 Tax=Dyella sp. SG609 TaxID=2587018 RepID=UPI00144564F8|nr:peptidylprolyl isomerase [Dyella sp. SG609]NKJ20208.1 hypothetical protein [Dyella sp. SG609]
MSSHRALFSLFVSASLVVVSTAVLSGTGKDAVVLSIGKEQWTSSQFRQLMDSTPPQIKTAAVDDPAAFAKKFSEMHLLASLAASRHLENDPDIRRKIEWLRQGVLANAARDELYRTAQVSDDEAKRYYDAHAGDFVDYTLQHVVIRYHASDIPLRQGQQDIGEAEARAQSEELRKQLMAGKDFSAIVEQHTDDLSSKADDGVLPETASRNLLPEIALGIAKLKEDEISQPIRTTFGYHLVRVMKRSQNTFEDAKPHIVILLKNEEVTRQIEALKQAHPTTFDAALLGHAPGG